MKNFQVKRLVTIGEKYVVDANVSANQEMLVLTMDVPDEFKPRKGEFLLDSWHKIKNAGNVPIYNLYCYESGSVEKLQLQVDNYFCRIQKLGNDWVLVGAVKDDRNDYAHIYSDKGEYLRRFKIGDYAIRIQTTPDGYLWVGYYEECRTLISCSGLACFDSLGNHVFNYNELADENNLIKVCNFNALNVISDKDVFLYYYPDFPLVWLKERKIHRVWRNIPVYEACSVAINEKYALFGEYSWVYLFSFKNGKKERLVPLNESGSVISRFISFARGSFLYLLVDNLIYFIDVNEL